MLNTSLRERFGRLLSSAGQMFWEMDRTFTVRFANELLKTTFGDPVGHTCHQFMCSSSEVCSGCPVERILFGGLERAVSERPRLDCDGRRIWLQHTATPIKNDAGEVVGASELIMDITQQKLNEEWLKDSERLYRNLVEQVPDIIFSLDDRGVFTFVNTQVEKFLGQPVQNVLDNPLADFVHSEDRDRLVGIFELNPEEVWDEEVAVVDATGNRRFARIRCKASFDPGGRLVGFEGVMRDRTVRRKLEEDLKASRAALVEKIKVIDELYEHIVEAGKCKAIADHTAEVAHELRQPLAIVGGFARRLAKGLDADQPPEPMKQKQYLTIIITEIQRLETILNGLIDFTRRDRIFRQGINPNDLIEYIAEITQDRMRDKQICLTLNLGAEIGDIPLDPGRFQQLVLNLIFNAFEASPAGGIILLETGVSIPSDRALRTGKLESETFFEMKIRNDGPPIAPEDIQNVFNPFFTTKTYGTGLGLSVSKKIVQDHHGSISVKSDDEGTVFTVWLPMGHESSTIPRSVSDVCIVDARV